MRYPWSTNAACLGMSDIMHPDSGNERAVRVAKAVCSSCPCVVECLEAAIAGDEVDGIWGGMTPKERHKRAMRR